MTAATERRREQVYRQLERVVDPELDMNIVRLGLIYDLLVTDDAVEVVMTLTTRGCPMQGAITAGVQSVVRELPWVRDVGVRVVWDPPWHPGMINDRPPAEHMRATDRERRLSP